MPTLWLLRLLFLLLLLLLLLILRKVLALLLLLVPQLLVLLLLLRLLLLFTFQGNCKRQNAIIPSLLVPFRYITYLFCSSILFGPWVCAWHQAWWTRTVSLPLRVAWWEEWATVQEDVPKFWSGKKINCCAPAVGLDKSPETKLHPLATWVLSASAAPFCSLWILVLVLALPLLTLGLLNSLHPCAAPPTPRLPRAHPRQRGSPHFVVAEWRHLVGETQGRARVCEGSKWQGSIRARGRESGETPYFSFTRWTLPSLNASVRWQSSSPHWFCLCLLGRLCVSAGLMLLSVDIGLLGRGSLRPGTVTIGTTSGKCSAKPCCVWPDSDKHDHPTAPAL